MQHFRFRILPIGIFFFLIIISLMTISPLSAINAQSDLSDDDLAQIDRIITALEKADTYTRFEFSTQTRETESLTGFLNNQMMMSLDYDYQATQTGRVVVGESGADSQYEMTLAGVQSSEVDPTVAQDYVIEAEVRVVDGELYARASYPNPQASFAIIPNGPVKVTDATLYAYPGLRDLRLDTAIETLDYPFSRRILGQTRDELKSLFTNTAASITVQQSTLDDGSPIDVITLTLNPDAWLVVSQDADIPDSVQRDIYDALENDPVVYYFLLAENDTLVGLGFSTSIGIADVDVGNGQDIPDGFLLNLTFSSSLDMSLTAINENLPPVDILATIEQVFPDTVPVPAIAGEMPWWNDRVFYEIFVRSFYDSDGDGIGDLRGVIEKLDYLNDGDPTTSDDLGITGIWLMPIAQSPSYHGYDVTDYYTIEEDYGTNDDFKELMQEAHQRGIVVIVDLVMNHTSSEHPWFQAAREGDPEYEDWYIWSDNNPGYPGPWNQNVWHRAGDRYFYGIFWEGMPDLNYETPEVTMQMNDIIRFWLEDMGVDGFRLDAVRHLIERGQIQENTPATLNWLQNFHVYVKSLNPDALTVGEIWDESREVVPYIGDKVDIAFEFDLAGAILDSPLRGRNGRLITVQQNVLRLYPPGQYATFLTNHDQNRIMSILNSDVEAGKVAATILLTSPGVPFLYYGEEVAMTGTKPDERIRTPMQWDTTRTTGGFTEGTPWETLTGGYRLYNVERMTDDPESLLSHYRNLIHLRNAHPALRTGAMQFVETSDSKLYAFLRYTDDKALLILVNLSKEAIDDYHLSLASGMLAQNADSGGELLLGQREGEFTLPEITSDGGFDDYTPLSELPPRSSFIIKLQ